MADSPTRVLLVDFGAIARKGFRDTLAERGFDVISLDCPVDQIEHWVRRHEPDVLVLDLDGQCTAELATDITAAFPDMKVIACSAEQPRMRVYPRHGGGESFHRELDPESLSDAVRS